MKKEELNRLFPNGYKEMEPVMYKRLSIIPQTFLVDEHRIHQYTSKDNDGEIIKAKRSLDLFRGSIATASLVAAIMYSLVETAKANGLRVYEYLEYVLTELAAHQNDTSRDFLADLLPWSKAAQKKCSSLKKVSKKI